MQQANRSLTAPRGLVFPIACLVLLFGSGSILALDPPHDGDASPAIDCSDCHSMDTASTWSSLITRGAEQEQQCKSCHNPSGQADTMTDVTNHVVTHNGTETIIDCGSCHNVHKTMASTDTHTGGGTADNLSHVRSNPRKYWKDHATATLVFQTSPDDLNFSSSPYNGACQACHTETDYHRNDGTGSTHESTSDCTTCHEHGEGWAASGCTNCHNSAQDDGDGTPSSGRREVVTEFARTSHHLAATPNEDDCEICHDQSQHQADKIRLFDVDDPTSSSAVTVLTGNPFTSSTEAAKLDGFCLSCHDTDGADGDTTPFSDGQTAVAIGGWTNSSHDTNSISCIGDGDGFGCHSTGHGSKKKNLLAPDGTAATSPDLAEEEEGFCFGCHTSGGTADTDIEADFPSTINTVGDGAGSNDSTTLNDRHDIQYAAANSSGAKIECWNCHDPHSATGTNPLILDPDPGDNHDPTKTADYYFSDSTFMTEWCLDCHDGSLPTGVSAPTTALTNIKTTWNDDDTHGAVNGAAKLKSGYGWGDDDYLQCLDCHAPHNGARSNGNLFQLKDLVKSKDGTTSVPSDRANPDEYVYDTTDNNNTDKVVNGFYWCNTCHDNSMGKNKSNCFNCHYHGNKF